MKTQKEVELELLDGWIERQMERMERRKQEIEDEWYLYAKCVGIPNLNKRR